MKQKKASPAAIVIFGAKGDLTRRKLVPALYNLFTGNHLPALFNIFCVDYVTVDENEFKAELLSGINEFSRSGNRRVRAGAAPLSRVPRIVVRGVGPL